MLNICKCLYTCQGEAKVILDMLSHCKGKWLLTIFDPVVGQILSIQHRRKELITCWADCEPQTWKPYTAWCGGDERQAPGKPKQEAFICCISTGLPYKERCFPDRKDGPSLETWAQCGAGIKQVRGRIRAVLARWRSIAFSPSWQSCQYPWTCPGHPQQPPSLHSHLTKIGKKRCHFCPERPRSSFHRPLSLVAFYIKCHRWLNRCTSA